MRMQGVVLLAAAVVLVSGKGNNVPERTCGSCGDCCADGWTYRADATTGEETCTIAVPTPDTCTLCGTGNGCTVTRTVGLKAEIFGTGASSGVSGMAALATVAPGGYSFDPRTNTAVFSDVPVHMADASTNLFPWAAEGGFEALLMCNKPTRPAAGCDGYVYVYHCATCATGTPVQLSAYLRDEGFAAFKCGLSFTMYGQKYNFVVFHKELAIGETVTLFYPYPISFMGTALQYKVQMCGEFLDSASCGAVDGCQWKDSVCVPGWCPQKWQGPSTQAGCPCPVDDNGQLAGA